MIRVLGRIRPHLTYANVVATLLLFIVLGGTAWALAKNSIGSRQIKPGAVRQADLAANSVGGRNVADGSLGSRDIAAGAAGAVPIEAEASTDTAPLEALSSRGLVLSMDCDSPGSSALAGLLASGPAGTQVNYGGIDHGEVSSEPFVGGLNLSDTPQAIRGIQDGAGGLGSVTYVHGVYRSATSTVSFEVALTARAGTSPLCRARGHAIPTTTS